jgi:hypothetical protein
VFTFKKCPTYITFLKHEERGGEENVCGGEASSGTDFFWGGWTNIFSASKVPGQCPFVLVVEVNWWEGKALGSEYNKWLGCGLCYPQS